MIHEGPLTWRISKDKTVGMDLPHHWYQEHWETSPWILSIPRDMGILTQPQQHYRDPLSPPLLHPLGHHPSWLQGGRFCLACEHIPG